MRRSLLALLAAAAVVAAVFVTAPTATASAASDHRRIVEYWTPERMASAIPRDIVLRGTPHDFAKPGTGGGSGNTTGSTWTGGGRVTITTGKVFFRENGTRYTCSGSAVDSSHGSLVLTAGHCVHGGGSGATFVTDWEFIPAWTGSTAPRPLGTWTATLLFTTSAWSSSGDFIDDAGFAVVTNGTTTTTLEDALLTNSTGISTAAPTVSFSASPVDNDRYTSFGYPAAKKYNGNVLTYCAGPVNVAWDGPGTMALPCNMTGGSSGGPWYRTFDNSQSPPGVVNSLNSYGYSSLQGYMFGPIFDGGEQSAYNAASGSSPACSTPSGYACSANVVTV